MHEINFTKSAIVCNQVYKTYKHTLNSYVSDFYLENHWNTKLSTSWNNFLEKLPIEYIGDLLDTDKPLQKVTCPLSLLCLREILKHYSISRKKVTINGLAEGIDGFHNIFWKNVKQKKRHEIEIISKICYQSALKTNCFNIVDIGSGLGHLSRVLAFKYGFNVVTFEANNKLTELAPKLDQQIEKMLKLKRILVINNKIIHIAKKIEDSITSKEFTHLVRKYFQDFSLDFKFGIVGLHPCGNLGSTLLKLYNGTASISFLNIVSCCYMKLSLEPSKPKGFPLSLFYNSRSYTLDYLSCETACHAIENYIEKVRTKDYGNLKIHAYRAALECLLVKTDRRLKHSAVGNAKYEIGMKFSQYCDKALKKSKVNLQTLDIEEFADIIENTWEKVVKFYSIRLLLAPLVESIILYDRILYLQESKSNCDILPVFDCQISPRNHVLSAQKCSDLV